MTRTGLLWLCLLVSVAAAAEDNAVTYLGGTVPGIRNGTTGTLDTASEAGLGFRYAGGKLVIAYPAIDSFEYSQPVARRLGVLPGIAVGLVKQRQHRHIFRITYHEENGVPQVAIFRVPKHMPGTLEAVFQTRAPRLCAAYYKCQGAR